MISYSLADGQATLAVSDDGIGLPPEADRPTGMGLHIMQYRAALIGGSLTIANAPEGGTIIQCHYAPRS